MKKSSDLYIFNSNALIALAKIEGDEWLKYQKEEFSKLDPNFNSFSNALNKYNETKHLYLDDICIAIIDGYINKYKVFADGFIKNE